MLEFKVHVAQPQVCTYVVKLGHSPLDHEYGLVHKAIHFDQCSRKTEPCLEESLYVRTSTVTHELRFHPFHLNVLHQYACTMAVNKI